MPRTIGPRSLPREARSPRSSATFPVAASASIRGRRVMAHRIPPRGTFARARLGNTPVMTLYVCWGTFPVPWPRRGAPWGPRHHPCKVAHDALARAGHAPEVVRVYGFRELPILTPGRR